jgi:hypothetical protein
MEDGVIHRHAPVTSERAAATGFTLNGGKQKGQVFRVEKTKGRNQ